MPKLRKAGLVWPKPIPSNCKYKYCDYVDPVYKTEKVVKLEVEKLCCCKTHCVRLRFREHEENDKMYNIFALHAGQDCAFMRRLLKFFMTDVTKRNFESAGCKCLSAKGLSLDSWSESIEDSWKGDFLLDTHTLVHFNEGKLWTTLKDPPKDHDAMLARCNFHLIYLGRGLSVELVKRIESTKIV